MGNELLKEARLREETGGRIRAGGAIVAIAGTGGAVETGLEGAAVHGMAEDMIICRFAMTAHLTLWLTIEHAVHQFFIRNQ
jgi:hypothetical protein